MIIFPTIILAAIIGLLAAIIWWITKRKSPSITKVTLFVVSLLSVFLGLSYVYISLIDYLVTYSPNLINYQIEYSSKEIIGTVSIVGVIFIIVGLDQFIKNWKKKN